MPTSTSVESAVSIAELKNLARKLLPSSSTLKRLILSEPDHLPADEVHSKISTYSRLLFIDTKENG